MLSHVIDYFEKRKMKDFCQTCLSSLPSPPKYQSCPNIVALQPLYTLVSFPNRKSRFSLNVPIIMNKFIQK